MVLVTGAVVLSSTARPAPAAVAVHRPDPLADSTARELDIALFERRLREDPWSAADRSRLAALYLRRARETGSFADVVRAEEQATQSLAQRTGHNDATWSLLASARLSRHDFTGALRAARAVMVADPSLPAHRGLLAEVLLELGRYQESDSLFRTLEGDASNLGSASRLIRWYELGGHLDRARVLAGHALRLATDDRELTAEQVAWYHLRAGDLEAKGGAIDRGDSLYAAGLAVNPGDYRLLAARARLAADRQQWKAAVGFGEQAIARQLEPGTLGILRDAWAALGDSAQAASYAAAMTASALAQPGAIHRAWGLHLADHGERLADVLARVRREQRDRRDVYGYDLEAWTLHAMGRDAEARRAIDHALAHGTEDALLWYHAGAIEAATGDSTAARMHLAGALALNSWFHPVRADSARALLAALGGPLRAEGAGR
jgi:tetratricopeptide (TPR) repeat protein